MSEQIQCVPLPLDTGDPYTLQAAHLMLTEVGRFANPTYVATDAEAIDYIERARKARPGTEAIYGVVDTSQGVVIAAGRASHRIQDTEVVYETYTHVAKVAVATGERGKGYLGIVLSEIDRVAQRVGDVTIRLTALEPQKFHSYGFSGSDDRLRATVGALTVANR